MRNENQCVLDLSELAGISRIDEPQLLKIAKQFESIGKARNHLTTGFKRLRIDAFSQVDRDAEWMRNVRSWSRGSLQMSHDNEGTI